MKTIDTSIHNALNTHFEALTVVVGEQHNGQTSPIVRKAVAHSVSERVMLLSFNDVLLDRVARVVGEEYVKGEQIKLVDNLATKNFYGQSVKLYDLLAQIKNTILTARVVTKVFYITHELYAELFRSHGCCLRELKIVGEMMGVVFWIGTSRRNAPDKTLQKVLSCQTRMVGDEVEIYPHGQHHDMVIFKYRPVDPMVKDVPDPNCETTKQLEKVRNSLAELEKVDTSKFTLEQQNVIAEQLTQSRELLLKIGDNVSNGLLKSL